MVTYDARRPPGPPPEETEIQPVKVNETLRIAQRLRNAYTREKALRRIRVCDADVAIYEYEPNDEWQALARKVQLRGIDPERFIHAAFLDSPEADATLANGPFSNNISGDKGFDKHVEKYSKYCLRADAQLEAEWSANAIQFELAVADLVERFPKRNIRKLWHFALTNGRYKLSPLFKYCIAASESIFDVQDKEWDSASLQLLTDPQGYLRVWKDRIPAGLKEYAACMLE